MGKAGSGVVDCVRQWGMWGVEWLTECASVGNAGSGVVDCVCVSGEGEI